MNKIYFTEQTWQNTMIFFFYSGNLFHLKWHKIFLICYIWISRLLEEYHIITIIIKQICNNGHSNLKKFKLHYQHTQRILINVDNTLWTVTSSEKDCVKTRTLIPVAASKMQRRCTAWCTPSPGGLTVPYPVEANSGTLRLHPC